MDYHIHQGKESGEDTDEAFSDEYDDKKTNRQSKKRQKRTLFRVIGVQTSQCMDRVLDTLDPCLNCFQTYKTCLMILLGLIAALFALTLVASTPQFMQFAVNHGWIEMIGDRTSMCLDKTGDAFHTNGDDDLYGKDDGPCPGLVYSEYNNLLMPSRREFTDGCNSCSYQVSRYDDDGSFGGFMCSEDACSGCSYNDWYYEAGQVVPHASGDSCNTCRCKMYENAAAADDDGENYEQHLPNYEIECTENECNTCMYEGAVYEYGETFSTGCRINNKDVVCTCQEDGEVLCANDDDDAQNSCGDYGYCTWQGRLYEEDECFQSDDGVNQCACMENGMVACTDCGNLFPYRK